MLESLGNDVITWVLSDKALDRLRADINAGELGRARLHKVEAVGNVGLVALAA